MYDDFNRKYSTQDLIQTNTRINSMTTISVIKYTYVLKRKKYVFGDTVQTLIQADKRKKCEREKLKKKKKKKL